MPLLHGKSGWSQVHLLSLKTVCSGPEADGRACLVAKLIARHRPPFRGEPGATRIRHGEFSTAPDSHYGRLEASSIGSFSTGQGVGSPSHRHLSRSKQRQVRYAASTASSVLPGLKEMTLTSFRQSMPACIDTEAKELRDSSELQHD